MIDVVFADHHELFHVGMKEIVKDTDDLYLMAHPRSTEELLSILATFVPHILVLSTKFLPALSKIEPLIQRRQTAVLLIAEESDRVAHVRWSRAQGIVYRSMDGPVLVDAIRRVARGESLLEDGSSFARNEPPNGDAESR